MLGLQRQQILKQSATIRIYEASTMPRKPSVALPDHVRMVTARGKSYYYYHPHRGTDQERPAVRIIGEPDTPAWWESYREAAGLSAPRINPKSFDHLIDAWQDSANWKQMGPKTRVEWARYCDRIRSAWGPLEVRGIEPLHVTHLRDKNVGHSANNLLRCLKVMLKWAVQNGYRPDNPAREIDMLKEGDGYAPWPWHVIHAAERDLRPDLWWSVAIALYTGQRQSDVLAMRWDAIKNGLITVRQNKTSKHLVIPMHRDLKVIIDQIPRHAITVLTNSKGRPWTESGFRATWRKRQPKEAKEAGLVFHGLRKTAVVTLLEAGCTDAEVSSITGQSRRMVEHYAKQVRQEALARSAVTRWENANRT